jgi:hypothetical protein
MQASPPRALIISADGMQAVTHNERQQRHELPALSIAELDSTERRTRQLTQLSGGPTDESQQGSVSKGKARVDDRATSGQERVDAASHGISQSAENSSERPGNSQRGFVMGAGRHPLREFMNTRQ